MSAGGFDESVYREIPDWVTPDYSDDVVFDPGEWHAPLGSEGSPRYLSAADYSRKCEVESLETFLKSYNRIQKAKMEETKYCLPCDVKPLESGIAHNILQYMLRGDLVPELRAREVKDVKKTRHPKKKSKKKKSKKKKKKSRFKLSRKRKSRKSRTRTK